MQRRLGPSQGPQAVENRRSALFFHEVGDVAAYRGAVCRLEEVAVSFADSVQLIADVINAKETTA